MELNLSFEPKKYTFNTNESSNINKQNKISKNLEKTIYTLFNKKYSKMPLYYNKYIIDNIIYNEKSHIVAKFKDGLINDDTGEFLKRYYTTSESKCRLPKFFEYYDLYSKIFPNYTTFYEGKYLYQNIQKKQKMIDLIEKMEMEGKLNKKNNGKFYSAPSERDGLHDVFNTDVIDSILNGTNNEGMEIIFNVNKNNSKQDDAIFSEEVSNIIKNINKCEAKKIIINKNSKNNFNTKINQNKNTSCTKLNKSNITWRNNNNLYKNNGYSTKREVYRIQNEKMSSNNISVNKIHSHEKKDKNKNIPIPMHIDFTKNKRILLNSNNNCNSTNTMNNTNNSYYNIKSIISKFFNSSSNKNYTLLNLRNSSSKNCKNNSEIMKNCKIGSNLVEKLEKNLMKIKQKSQSHQKNMSQNSSTTNQTQKDASTSRKNNISNVYSKKSSSMSTSHNTQQTQKNINKNNYKNNYIPYNISNNFINSLIHNKRYNYNYNFMNHENSPLTARNPKPEEINIYQLSKIKNYKKIQGIKGNNNNLYSNNDYNNNAYFLPDSTSRNKYGKNVNNFYKSKSTLRGSVYSSCGSIKDKNSQSKSKNKINNKGEVSSRNSCRDIHTMKEFKIGKYYNYSIKNIKKNNDRLISNEYNLLSSRNKETSNKRINISQPKTIFDKKFGAKTNISRNESALKLEFLDITNIKKKGNKGINICNFSKVINVSKNTGLNNNTYKNAFVCKTQKKKY